MAITLGTPAYAYRASGSGASISYSVSSFTVPTGATGLLIFVHILTAIVGNPIVTFTNGTTVTATLEKTLAGASNQGQIFVYSVANPASGTGTITFNQPSGFAAGYIDASYLEVIAVSGGDSTTVVHASDAKGAGNSSAPSVTTTVDNCVFVTTAGTYYNGTAPSYASGPPSSSLWSDSDNTQFLFVGRSIAAQVIGTYTATWTVGFNGCVASLVALNPGSGGGGGTAQNVSATAIASGETFGSPARTAAVTLTQAGIGSTEAFGAITLTASVTLALTGIASAEAFGAPTLSQINALPVTGIASAEAFGTPTMGSGNSAQTVSGIASSEAFGAPTVAPGNSAQSVSGIASGEAFGSPTVSTAGAGSSGFLYYRAITIDRTKVSADQSNFPVQITGTFAYLATIANGGKVQSSSGYDIALYADSSASTLLDFERVTWSASTGASELWVRIPSLSASVDTTIYLFYGKASQTTDLANKTGVWDANHVAVFHCNETTPANGSTVNDSTTSANPLTIGAMSGGVGTATLAQSAGPWTGSSGLAITQQTEYLGYSAAQAATSGMGVSHSTLSGWWKPQKSHSGYDSVAYIFGTEPISYPSRANELLQLQDNTVKLRVGTESETSGATSTLTAGAWYHLAATFDGSTAKIYVNGASAVSTAISRSTVDDKLFAGQAGGAFDELRASKVVRSASWVATEYASMSAAFLAIGSETTTGVSLSVSGIASTEAFGTLTVAPGTANKAQTGIASAEAFGTPTPASGNSAFSLTGIASTEAFGAPTVAPGGVARAQTGIPTAEAFGAPTSAPGSATLAPTGIASAESFGTPVRTSAVTLPQTGIPSGEALGAPSIGNFTSLPQTGIPSAEAFGAPVVAPGPALLSLSGIPSAEAFGSPALGSGAGVIATNGIPSAEAFGSASFNAQAALAITGIPTAEAFGTPLAFANGRLLLSGIPTAETFGTAGIVGTAVISGTAIGSGEAFGLVSTSGAVALSVTAIPGAEAFGFPIFEQPQTFFLTGIPSAEASAGVRIIPSKPKRVITFPNGQVLTSMALTPQAINVTLQTLTCYMLGIDPAQDPQAYYKVRLEWPTQGQPAWGINEDICFLRATEEDGDYNKIRDRRLSYQDEATLESTDTYTRIWRVSWAFYGPNAFDNARQLKSALMSWDFSTDTLAQMSLYLNTEIGATTRAPEKFQGQWWERSDLSVRMNELVTESLTVTSIASAEILLIDNDRGQVADITV